MPAWDAGHLRESGEDVVTDANMTQRRTFFGAMRGLAKDRRGNTLLLVAAVLLPLTAMVGAAVDTSRAYMAKLRLQQACDAGVLAGRRSMAEGMFDDADEAEANKMFNFNFPEGIYSSTDRRFETEQRGAAEVMGIASATIPTMIMKIIKYDQFDIEVECVAVLEVNNTDVMMVLDTTGSMNTTNPGDSMTRIEGLKGAVLAFFDVLSAAQLENADVRYGFVPYAHNVNVGKLLYDKDPDWLVDSWTYQSRVANYTTPSYTRTSETVSASGTQVFSYPLTISQCLSYGTNTGFAGYFGGSFTPSPTGNPARISGSVPGTVVERQYQNSSADWGYSGAGITSGWFRTCRRTYEERTAVYVASGYGFTNWTYQPVEYDVSNFLAGEEVEIAVSSGGSISSSGSHDLLGLPIANGASGLNTTKVTWDGCIEERDTTAFNSSTVDMPDDAFDTDIDTIPHNDATRWRPAFKNVVYGRGANAWDWVAATTPVTTTANYSSYGTNEWGECSSESMKLTSFEDTDRTDIEQYLQDMYVDGATFHDIGMTWAVRLMSPTGLFADENVAPANGAQLTRHIIFMTDGILYANPTIYGAWGHEYMNRRVTGTDAYNLTEGIERHRRRFEAACSAAKARNITVWVVSFGVSLDDSLRSCASTANKAFQATNSDELREIYEKIAGKIADLRLSQ
ncbi:MAG: hypothetical protein RLZZ58_1241 [Pseudomonadota bacterium]